MSKTIKEMVINYVPGEECRVAVTDDSRLEELHAERMDNASHVGNIYVGRVVNVEPAIQAAFVDFGLEANGFLHVTDLHPRYFPGEDQETTERVGKKTPRRERPPIQACLRRGQEIAVQVLKEGVGSKGPTVTSYLSIPGRFLVMMPLMDKVGVSRKVEDEETRRKMRDILDQLDLPDGFGFILRTAGMDRGKMELKRDLAYLQRLWKDMEKRWKTGNKPRLLYSESDLLVRSLRDILTTDIDRVVVDNEAALNRASRFLKIVAPRSSTKLVRYTGNAPLFHAMGIEQQIQTIHAREVPLPGGGRLVIDETEALVAIDVNSGKMRDAKDAETTAYRTNMEAADEIARQLRLRDVGGVIVNDFIDMRSLKHRRELETRFKDNLKKDRARTTTAPVSPFGVIEMTRQRMRGSHESVHFAGCPTCRGRGLLQKPDSVAADGLRELQAILASDKVFRVELVVSPRIAGELLSSKRKALSRVERSMAKRVDVRVSEAIPLDRVSFYAYDERGADVDVAKVQVRTAPESDFLVFEAPDLENWAEEPEILSDADDEAAAPEEESLHPIEMDDAQLDRERGVAAEEPSSAGHAGGRRAESRDDRGGRGRGRRGRGAKDDRADHPAREEAPHGERPRRADAPVPNGGRPAQPSTLRVVDGIDAGQPPRDGEEGGEQRRGRRRRRRGGRGRGKGMDGPRTAGQDFRASLDTDAPGENPARNDAEGHRRDDDESDRNAFGGDDRGPARTSESLDGPADREFSTEAASDTAGGPSDRREGDGPNRGKRRRGGRGRNRSGRGPQSRDHVPAADGSRPNPAAERGGPAPTRAVEHREATSDGDGPSTAAGDQQDRAPAGGEERRGRRRRGGRGRNRGGKGPAGGDSGSTGSAPPREPQGDRGPRQNPRMNGDSRPPQSNAGSGSSGQRPGSGGGAGQSSPPPPAKGPRTLYGGARRKLSPGELRTRPKADE